MQFAAFIWTKWDTDEDIDPAEFGRYSEFNTQADEAGVRRGGFALHPVSSATTIRLRKQDTLVTDGPFIESKEQLSGLYIFECDNLDSRVRQRARLLTIRGRARTRRTRAMPVFVRGSVRSGRAKRARWNLSRCMRSGCRRARTWFCRPATRTMRACRCHSGARCHGRVLVAQDRSWVG